MILLAGSAAVLALAANAINPSGIALVGEYYEIEYGADSVIIPPTAEEGDSPYITLKEAYGMYHDPGTIFLDAREPEDYELGHIKGAINLPFDWFDDHWLDVEPLLDPEAAIIIYCSGTECELSIHEARHLQTLGYQNLYVFFGGWDEWVEHDFPTDKL
jgi:rhodanese-related sulfurtransferase